MLPAPTTTWTPAQPPFPSRRYPLTKVLQQYLILLCVLLAEYRRTWFFHLVRSLLFPISFLFLASATRGTVDTGQAIFLLGGTLASSLAFGPTSTLINKLGWGRQRHEFDYWITLPVLKVALVLAMMSIALFFALPGLIGAYFVGSFLLGLPVTASPALIPLLLLGALSIAGLAAFLGSYAPNGQVAGMIGNTMTIFIGFLSPLFIPLNLLPLPLRILNLFLPSTYIADAFRTILGGQAEIPFALDLLILLAFSLTFLFLVHHKLDWRTQ